MTPLFANILCLLPGFFGSPGQCDKTVEEHRVVKESSATQPKVTRRPSTDQDSKIGKPLLKDDDRSVMPAAKKILTSIRSSSSDSGIVTQKSDGGSTPSIQVQASKPAPTESEEKKTVQTKEIDRILDGLQAYYKEQKDLKSEFIQTYTYVKMGRKKVSKGRVFFKTPHRMRFDYASPTRKLIISDGQTLWIYEPDQFQAFKRDLRGSQLPVAMTFMSGQGDLREEFTGALLSKTAETIIIELTPKKDEGHYQSLRLELDAKTFAVHSSTVVDPVGNLNEIRFSDLVTNTGLPDAGFQFKVPDGVHVVE